MSGRRFALVAGGGTAGHVLPALAVARSLQARHGPGSVELVGSRRGVEAHLAPARGVATTLLPGRGIVRRLTPEALAANIGAVAGLAVAFVMALAVVKRARPAVVVAVGGYASLPAAVAAVVFGVPIVLLNVDAVPGAANRLLGRVARASAVAYPGTTLPRAVVTGAPVRDEVLAVATATGEERVAARRRLGLPGTAFVVAAFGGSLGARRINDAVAELAGSWLAAGDRAIYHVVGRRNAGGAGGAPGAGEDRGGGGAGRPVGAGASERYRVVAYEEHMDDLYRAADVAVCRAGAMTVAELAAAGMPAILVPLPGAPDDHQAANAAVLAGAGAAVVVDDASCTGPVLATTLDELGDPTTLGRMRDAARSLARSDAAGAVASVAEAHARSRRCPRGGSAGRAPAST